MAKLSLLDCFDDYVRSNAVLNEGIEKEFISFVSHQEECRKHWFAEQSELLLLREENAKLKVDNETLQVHLKHARNEQITEQKKRLQMESQVSRIRELLNDEDTRSRLKDNEVELLTRISHSQNTPVKRQHDASNASNLSPYSENDYTDDDLDDANTSALRSGRIWKRTNTMSKLGEPNEKEETPPKKLRKSYSAADAMTPVSQKEMAPVNGMGKAISSACLKPTENYLNERPPSGNKPQHQQVTRLSHLPSNNRTPANSPGTPTWSQTPTDKSSGKKPKNHDFISKTVLRPESCKPCGKMIRFAKMALKCRDCRAICHTDCKKSVPTPCIPVKRTPNSGRKIVEENIEFYAPTVSPRIPTIVLRCVQELERRGLNQVGLYRIPGTETRVRELKTKFLEGRGSPDLTKENDENVICGLLKAFLKQLSEPILTFTLHQRFLEAAQSPDGDDALLFQAVSELPSANRDTLAYLMIHLQKVSQSKECKMPIANIAKVFAPTLVGYSCSKPEPVQMLTEAKIQPKVVEKLLLMPADYWNQFLHVQEENIRSPPFNPNTHNADGTPKTPQPANAPGSGRMLGQVRSGGTPNGKSIKKKGSLLSRTPLTPRFGSKSKNPNRRPHHFFDSPMLK